MLETKKQNKGHKYLAKFKFSYFPKSIIKVNIKSSIVCYIKSKIFKTI